MAETVELTDTPTQTIPVRSEAVEPSIGELGRYQMKQLLGRGGFGRVFRAFDPQLERFVALKIPLKKVSDRPRIERFLNEARLVAKLRHPNIVSVFDAGELQGWPYIANEFVDGRTLSSLLAEGRPPVENAVRWVKQAARALAYAHRHGVIHRDIKPHNIMLNAAGEPQILDFGMARLQVQASGGEEERSFEGTPAYMSPEQVRGEASRIGPATDQYSLGITLYELLAGARPFGGSSTVVMQKAVEISAPAIRTVRPDVPADLDAICLKAISKHPVDRYPDCNALAEDLERWERGEPVLARPLGVHQRLWRWRRRNPLVAALAAAFCLSVLIGAGAVVVVKARAIESEQAAKRKTRDAEKNAEDLKNAAQDLETERNLVKERNAKLERDQAEAERRERERTQKEQADAADRARLAQDATEQAAREAARLQTLAQLDFARRGYASEMRAAQGAWEAGHLSQFRRVLSRYERERLPDQSDPRKFEYGYWKRLESACAVALPNVSGLTDIKALQGHDLLVTGTDRGEMTIVEPQDGTIRFRAEDLPRGRMAVATLSGFIDPKGDFSRFNLEGDGRAISFVIAGAADGVLRVYTVGQWDRPPDVVRAGSGPIDLLIPGPFDPTMRAGKDTRTLQTPLPLMIAFSADEARSVQLQTAKTTGDRITGENLRVVKPVKLEFGTDTTIWNEITAAAVFSPYFANPRGPQQRPITIAVAAAARNGDVLYWGYTMRPAPRGQGFAGVTPTPVYAVLTGASPPVSHLGITGDGTTIYAVDQEGDLKSWNLVSGLKVGENRIACVKSLPAQGITSLCLAPHERMAIGKQDGSVDLLDMTREMEALETRRLHIEPVTHVASLGEDDLVAASRSDGEMFRWRILAKTQLDKIPVPGDVFTTSDFAPGGASLWTVSGSIISRTLAGRSTERLPIVALRSPVTRLRVSPDDVHCLAMTAEGEAVLVHHQNGEIRRWGDVVDGCIDRESVRLLTTQGRLLARRLAGGQEEDLPSSHPTSTPFLLLEDGRILSALIGGPKKWTYSTVVDGVWQSRWELLVEAVENPSGPEVAERAAGAQAERYFERLAHSGRPALENSPTVSAALSVKGDQLALAGLDPIIRLVDPATGMVKKELAGHAGRVTAVTFSADGERLATADDAGEVMVWDANSGEALLSLTGGGRQASWIGFDDSGRYLAASGAGWACWWSGEPPK
ncbi:Serine/threonine-protein kinase PknB [Caulifigura coniformis]|uniref:Serine/threonine-protein kinase PknB n=1 Tax=Caulifigura coniformis TaxID=2527983 RepID=A0A517SLL5_9PLAN|nr:WD40 repeat domain-containing serine/threonine-protein kinase [Caulifigura coniformis]QDT57010.1 Serine/threonine-protein kinase PknB [Caulifigura coniformis]